MSFLLDTGAREVTTSDVAYSFMNISRKLNQILQKPTPPPSGAISWYVGYTGWFHTAG